MAIVEKFEAKMMAKFGTNQEEIDTRLEEMKDGRKEMMVDQEAMEAYPEKIKSLVEHQEVPKEEAVVETLKALEDRYGDLDLAAGHLRPLKKQTHGSSGSQKMLATASRRLTCRVVSAPRKGHGRRGSGMDNITRGAPKGRTLKRI
jgi:hypothetical protein